VILRGRKLTLLAIDCASGGGEDDLLDTVSCAVLEETERSNQVDASVEDRFANRSPDVHLGGLVGEYLGPEIFEDIRAPTPDVPFPETRTLRNIAAMAAREVIYDRYFVPTREQVLRYV
jgi:hypothetical protein